MTHTPETCDDLVVDPSRYELDAAWVKEASVWGRVAERLLRCVDRQTAAIGILAIVVLCSWAGIRAHDTVILIAAFVCITAIAMSAEYLNGTNNDRHRGEGAAESGHASPHQGVA